MYNLAGWERSREGKESTQGGIARVARVREVRSYSYIPSWWMFFIFLFFFTDFVYIAWS
jgi:hypothetical protein